LPLAREARCHCWTVPQADEARAPAMNKAVMLDGRRLPFKIPPIP
jgi:hypothetical protein